MSVSTSNPKVNDHPPHTPRAPSKPWVAALVHGATLATLGAFGDVLGERWLVFALIAAVVIMIACVIARAFWKVGQLSWPRVVFGPVALGAGLSLCFGIYSAILYLTGGWDGGPRSALIGATSCGLLGVSLCLIEGAVRARGRSEPRSDASPNAGEPQPKWEK